MERYTPNLKLPKIVRITAAPRCESEEDDMIDRNVFMHTPTGAIVEVIPGEDFFLDKDYMEYRFCESCKYTALLLNKPHNTSNEENMKALKEVAKWFAKYADEYHHLNSLNWSLM